MVKSAYIHIPFCKSKCHYCSFVSFVDYDSKEQYLKALKSEILANYDGEDLKTLYIGGGTPSVLEVGEIEDLIRLFKFEDDVEITVELNPEDVDYDYLNGLYNLGINRLSFGCQTFDDKILKLINRRHNCSQVKNVIKLAQEIGFKNLSLDFIYGLPEQSPEGFVNDLKTAVDMGLKHISLYGLKIDEGCYFYKNMPQNLPDDDLQADMFVAAVETLVDCGFEHYEVSNFARSGFFSKHNMNYWNNEEYYGFGVGAHGYKNGVRYENVESIHDYLINPNEKKDSHSLSFEEKLEEEIFLGLRRMSGIDVCFINRKFGIDFEEKYKEILDKYTKLNLLEKTFCGYKFTVNGILVSNVVLADFIDG